MALLCCVLGLVLLRSADAHAATATEIGVAAAVRPDVRGTPPDQETRILSVGTDLHAEEHVITSRQGQTHLLFVDGSTLSMGPGSELTLDRFVYDPQQKVGELVVSASKGLLRFVGGRISKTRPVLVRTPTAVIGIRGGVAIIEIGAPDTPSSVTMLYGSEVFMESGGQRQTMQRPGFRITQSAGGEVNPPQQATQQELTQQLQILEEPPTVEEEPDAEQSLGNIEPAAGGSVSDEDVAGMQLSEAGSQGEPVAEEVPTEAGTPSGGATAETTTAQQQGATTLARHPLGDPVDEDATTNQVNESTPNLAAVGIRVSASPRSARDVVTYSLVDNAGGRFAINPTSGVIRVTNAALLDAETAQGHTVVVRATSADGSFTTATFAIAIADDNTEFTISTPVDSASATNYVADAAAAGTATNLIASAGDADVSDANGIVYTLATDAGGRFQIGTASGVVSTTATPTEFKTARRHTVVVGARSPDGTTASSSFSIEVIHDSFQGRLKRDASASIEGTNDADANNNSPLTDVRLGFGNLTASIAGGSQTLTLPFPDTASSSSFASAGAWPFGGLAGISQGVLNSNQTFIYYEILDAAATRSLVFAGDPATTFPTTGMTRYRLTRDFVRNEEFPFVSGFPIAGLTEHGRVYVAWDNTAALSQRAMGGGLVYISGTGSSQTSAAYYITGRVLDDPSATRHASASYFGSSRTAAGAQAARYSGGLASSDTGGQADFFGSAAGAAPDAFVLESATVNSADVVQSIGLTRRFEGNDTTFNANSVALRDTAANTAATRTSQSLTGFATGNQEIVSGATNSFIGRVFAANNDPASIDIVTDAALNTVGVTFNLNDFDGRDIVYQFGNSVSADGTGAFIADGRFAATGATATVNSSNVTAALGLITSDVAVFEGSGVPAGFDLCDCDHLTWGFWSATRDFVSGSPLTAITHLGTWVAGDGNGVDVTGSNVLGAVYSGNVIGNVLSGGINGDEYLASGGIELTFNFSPGSFTLEDVTVSDFDGVTYTSVPGSGSSFNGNQYNSSDAGLTIVSGARTLTLQGAFFAAQPLPAPPAATAGQVQISGGGYFASLLYGATLQP